MILSIPPSKTAIFRRRGGMLSVISCDRWMRQGRDSPGHFELALYNTSESVWAHFMKIKQKCGVWSKACPQNLRKWPDYGLCTRQKFSVNLVIFFLSLFCTWNQPTNLPKEIPDASQRITFESVLVFESLLLVLEISPSLTKTPLSPLVSCGRW